MISLYSEDTVQAIVSPGYHNMIVLSLSQTLPWAFSFPQQEWQSRKKGTQCTFCKRHCWTLWAFYILPLPLSSSKMIYPTLPVLVNKESLRILPLLENLLHIPGHRSTLWGLARPQQQHSRWNRRDVPVMFVQPSCVLLISSPLQPSVPLMSDTHAHTQNINQLLGFCEKRCIATNHWPGRCARWEEDTYWNGWGPLERNIVWCCPRALQLGSMVKMPIHRTWKCAWTSSALENGTVENPLCTIPSCVLACFACCCCCSVFDLICFSLARRGRTSNTGDHPPLSESVAT